MAGRKKNRISPFAGRRRAALRQAAAAGKVDALLITAEDDVGYLSGFTAGDSVLVVARRWACLITDGRYSQRAGEECVDIGVHVRPGPMPQAIAAVLKGKSVRRLGVQADHMTLAARDRLAAVIGAGRIRPISGLTEPLRVVKDAGELAAISKAVRVAERAFKALIAAGAAALVGRSEREVAAELDHHMRNFGASSAAFETMVAAGAHAACPHYSPDGTRIRRDQAVLFDWGAMVGGYCSDLTRTVFTGKIPPEIAEVYAVVLRAQAAAIAAIAPGVAGRTVDRAAREVIEQAGFGPQFLHGTGHGVGRAVHESPALGSDQTGRLRKGMIVTVEPGIYLPGVGGVRIEDDVLVTSTGRRRLSSLDRKLSAMQLR